MNCYNKLKFDGTLGQYLMFLSLPTAFDVARSLSLLPALTVDLCFSLNPQS